MRTITVIPTSYSKCKSTAQYIKALQVYPKQKCNTTEACQGKVFEVYVKGEVNKGCGSLDEMMLAYGPDTEMVL